MGIIPDIQTSPETDEGLINEITESIRKYRENEENVEDFSYELAWIIETINKKAKNTSMCLFQAGIIFKEQFIAINSATVGKILGITTAQVSRRIRTWSVVFWDPIEKRQLLNSFDVRTDLKQWGLRQPQLDDPIMIYSGNKPQLEGLQDIRFANLIPQIPPTQLVKISVDYIEQHNLYRGVDANIEPSRWNFDTSPSEVYEF